MINNILVYQHKRLDTNEIFYIGIGNEKRPISKSRRNDYWKNIVTKHGYKVEILHENLNWDLACNIEIQLISYYGRKDLNKGNLCNMTDGGEGTLGRKMLETTKEKIKIANKGSLRNLGRKMSEEAKIKIRESKLNKPLLKSRKKIINIETNEIYDSILDVLKIYPITKSCLYSFLNGYRKNTSVYRYY